MILLALAFFIYWIFNPSWAARLRYNVRTFPQRVSSWISSGKEFLDYDSYKLNIPSVSDIDLNIDSDWDFLDSDMDVIDDFDEDEEKSKVEDNEFVDAEKWKSDRSWKTIRSFANNTSLSFINIESLNTQSYTQKDWNIFEWYSKTDLLWIINSYIEKNLDDDTDILVTVEYEDDNKDPQKIILQTQEKKVDLVSHSVSLGVVEAESEKNNQELEIKKVDNVQQSKSSNKLTQKEIKETEELFSILF